MDARARLIVAFIRTLPALFKCNLDYEIFGVAEISIFFWDVTPCRLVTQSRQERILHWFTLKKHPTIVGVTSLIIEE